MTTERELSAEVRPAKLVDADPSSSSSNLDSTDSTGGGGKMAVSLATMEKGDLLPPHLKRQRVFQDFWFILGGVSAVSPCVVPICRFGFFSKSLR